ncbi:MAG: Cys-tRNA(Pro) deacylase [Actinobacteria bacterium]|nr:Cys-tRNA(Pro) deacylase [Actinomycetota bacterium]
MTPAIDLLRMLGIDHDHVEYHHDPAHASFGIEAAEALGVDADSIFKTLMVTFDDGTHAIGIVPVVCKLDLRAMAAAAGAKKAAMTDPDEAERRSGYVVGGISPFGQKRPSPTFLDEWAMAHDRIHCSGGRRGLEVGLAPDDLVSVLDAAVAPIAVWPH